jgi:hypothetical protein
MTPEINRQPTPRAGTAGKRTSAPGDLKARLTRRRDFLGFRVRGGAYILPSRETIGGIVRPVFRRRLALLRDDDCFRL